MPKAKVQPKNKYSEIIKKVKEEQDEQDDLEIDELPLPEKPEPSEKPEEPEQEANEQEDKPKEKSKRKYVKKPKELYAGPAQVAQYNQVLERVGTLAELFSKMQEEQLRLNNLVEKTVKATNESQTSKVDDMLKQSREFFARMAAR